MALRKSSDPEIQKLRNEIILKPGMKINKLTLLEKQGSNWVCKCDCGNTITITRAYRLKNELIGNVQDHTGSCGCLQKKSFSNANRQGTKETNILGQIINNWKIIDKTAFIDSNRSTLYICQNVKNKNYNLMSKRHLEGCSGVKCNQKYEEIQEQINNYIRCPHLGSKQEENILNILKNNNVHGNIQYTFFDCKDKNLLPFDFFIENKYIIEYDGEQHFKINNFFGGEEGFYIRRAHDLIKNKYCFENNIPLIRIPYDVKYDLNDLKLETTRFLLTPENEKEYYELRK